MTLVFPPPDELLRFFFLTIRISALLLTMPLFGARIVPTQVKMVCVLMVSFGMYPAVPAVPLNISHDVGVLVLLAIGELLVGLMMGYVGQILFVGVQLGGELISQQMGLSLATIFDPQNASSISVVSNFQYIIAVLVFFSLSAHHWFFLALAESLHTVPLLESTITHKAPMALVHLVGKALVMAVKFAAPMLVALLLVTFGMGIMARLVPQLNIFVLSFPVNLGVGLLVLSLTLFYLLGELRSVFKSLGFELMGLVQLLGNG